LLPQQPVLLSLIVIITTTTTTTPVQVEVQAVVVLGVMGVLPVLVVITIAVDIKDKDKDDDDDHRCTLRPILTRVMTITTITTVLKKLHGLLHLIIPNSVIVKEKGEGGEEEEAISAAIRATTSVLFVLNLV
jgi:hypothetical protein